MDELDTLERQGRVVTPSYETWPDRWELVDEYAAGKPAHVLAREHHRRYPSVKAWLVSLGLWRTPSERTRLWHKRAAKSAPAAPRKPWLPTPDAVMMDVYDLPSLVPATSDLCSFTPMLTVDIGSGTVLLNRLAEVMGDVFAEYSHNSAYALGDVKIKPLGYDSATVLSRSSRRTISRLIRGGKRRG